MDRRPVTAVITYTRDHIKYLMRAVESIEKQVDEVLTICDVPRMGQFVRLNELVSKARNPWIAIQDADDISIPSRIEHWDFCMDIFGETDIFCSAMRVNGFTKPSYVPDRTIYKRDSVMFPTVIFDKKVWEDIKFPEDKHTRKYGNGDWWWVAMAYKKHYTFMESPFETVIYSEKTSTYKSYLPVYRKARRLWRDYIMKKRLQKIAEL